MLLLLAFLFCQSAMAVNGTQNQVEVTEKILDGSKWAAEGITVKNRTQAEDQLFWDTSFTVGEDWKSHTDFTFYNERYQERGTSHPDLSLFLAANFTSSGNVLDSQDESRSFHRIMLKPAEDVASRTAAGETREEELYLKDYYTYFPIGVDITTGNGEGAAGPELDDAFARRIRIPISENHKIRVSVTKDSDGTVNQISSSNVSGAIEPFAYAVFTEEGGYFTIAAFDSDGETEAVLPEDMSGLYFLPAEKRDGSTTFLPDQMKMIYPIDSSQSYPLRLINGLDGKSRLLFTGGQEEIRVEVIEKGRLKQSVSLMKLDEPKEVGISEVMEYETFLVPIFTDGSFCVLTEGEKGYEISLRGDFYEGTAVDQYEKDLSFREMAMDFDGERLAAVFYPYRYETSSLYLMVFEEKGLGCVAKYDFSSDRRVPDTPYVVCPSYFNPLQVRVQ